MSTTANEPAPPASLLPTWQADAPPPASPRRLARLAGVLYLLVGVLGGGVHLLAREGASIPGDAPATAAAVAADERLLRLAFSADLVHLVCFVLLAIVLFALLEHVSRWAASAMVLFVALAVAIMGASLVNHLAAVQVATDSAYGALGEQRAVLTTLFLDLHGIGFGVAEVFFGLWLLPLGYLVVRSGYFPRALGYLLVAGGAAYLTLALVTPVVPTLTAAITDGLSFVPAAAEIATVLYLLVRGVRTAGAAAQAVSA